MKKELLFSVTAKDCEWQYFRGTGPGGQKRNKTENCVRCIHRASGAVGESRESRSQRDNREIAFRRMASTEEFKKWHRIEAARLTGQLLDIDDTVDRAMNSKNLKVEQKSEDGIWIDYEGSRNSQSFKEGT